MKLRSWLVDLFAGTRWCLGWFPSPSPPPCWRLLSSDTLSPSLKSICHRSKISQTPFSTEITNCSHISSLEKVTEASSNGCYHLPRLRSSDSPALCRPMPARLYTGTPSTALVEAATERYQLRAAAGVSWGVAGKAESTVYHHDANTRVNHMMLRGSQTAETLKCKVDTFTIGRHPWSAKTERNTRLAPSDGSTTWFDRNVACWIGMIKFRQRDVEYLFFEKISNGHFICVVFSPECVTVLLHLVYSILSHFCQ